MRGRKVFTRFSIFYFRFIFYLFFTITDRYIRVEGLEGNGLSDGWGDGVWVGGGG